MSKKILAVMLSVALSVPFGTKITQKELQRLRLRLQNYRQS